MAHCRQPSSILDKALRAPSGPRKNSFARSGEERVPLAKRDDEEYRGYFERARQPAVAGSGEMDEQVSRGP